MPSITCTPDRLHIEIDPQGDRWRPYMTLCDHYFREGLALSTVPKGFRTDLTSWFRRLGWALLLGMVLRCWLAWWLDFELAVAIFALLLRDYSGRCQLPALLHDWLYFIGVPKREADQRYRNLMRHFEVNRFRLLANYWGVKYGGHLSYYRHRLREHRVKV